jgi:hypothetical protein
MPARQLAEGLFLAFNSLPAKGRHQGLLRIDRFGLRLGPILRLGWRWMESTYAWPFFARRRSKLTAPGLERLARAPCPIASLASSGAKPFSSALVCHDRGGSNGSAKTPRRTPPRQSTRSCRRYEEMLRFMASAARCQKKAEVAQHETRRPRKRP